MPAPVPPPPAMPPSPPKGGGKSPVVILGLLAIVAVAIVAGGMALTGDDDDDGGAGTVAAPQQDGLPADPEIKDDVFGGGGDAESGSGDGAAANFCTQVGALTEGHGLEVADALSADALYKFDPAYLDGYRALVPPDEIAADFAVSVTFVEQVIGGTPYPLSDISGPTDEVRAYIDENC